MNGEVRLSRVLCQILLSLSDGQNSDIYILLSDTAADQYGFHDHIGPLCLLHHLSEKGFFLHLLPTQLYSFPVVIYAGKNWGIQFYRKCVWLIGRILPLEVPH